MACWRLESGITEAVEVGRIVGGGWVEVCGAGIASDPFKDIVSRARDCPKKWIGAGIVGDAASADTDRTKGCVGAVPSEYAKDPRLVGTCEGASAGVLAEAT